MQFIFILLLSLSLHSLAPKSHVAELNPIPTVFQLVKAQDNFSLSSASRNQVQRFLHKVLPLLRQTTWTNGKITFENCLSSDALAIYYTSCVMSDTFKAELATELAELKNDTPLTRGASPYSFSLSPFDFKNIPQIPSQTLPFFEIKPKQTIGSPDFILCLTKFWEAHQTLRQEINRSIADIDRYHKETSLTGEFFGHSPSIFSLHSCILASKISYHEAVEILVQFQDKNPHLSQSLNNGLLQIQNLYRQLHKQSQEIYRELWDNPKTSKKLYFLKPTFDTMGQESIALLLEQFLPEEEVLNPQQDILVQTFLKGLHLFMTKVKFENLLNQIGYPFLQFIRDFNFELLHKAIQTKIPIAKRDSFLRVHHALLKIWKRIDQISAPHLKDTIKEHIPYVVAIPTSQNILRQEPSLEIPNLEIKNLSEWLAKKCNSSLKNSKASSFWTHLVFLVKNLSEQIPTENFTSIQQPLLEGDFTLCEQKIVEYYLTSNPVKGSTRAKILENISLLRHIKKEWQQIQQQTPCIFPSKWYQQIILEVSQVPTDYLPQEVSTIFQIIPLDIVIQIESKTIRTVLMYLSNLMVFQQEMTQSIQSLEYFFEEVHCRHFLKPLNLEEIKMLTDQEDYDKSKYSSLSQTEKESLSKYLTRYKQKQTSLIQAFRSLVSIYKLWQQDEIIVLLSQEKYHHHAPHNIFFPTGITVLLFQVVYRHYRIDISDPAQEFLFGKMWESLWGQITVQYHPSSRPLLQIDLKTLLQMIPLYNQGCFEVENPAEFPYYRFCQAHYFAIQEQLQSITNLPKLELLEEDHQHPNLEQTKSYLNAIAVQIYQRCQHQVRYQSRTKHYQQLYERYPSTRKSFYRTTLTNNTTVKRLIEQGEKILAEGIEAQITSVHQIITTMKIQYKQERGMALRVLEMAISVLEQFQDELQKQTDFTPTYPYHLTLLVRHMSLPLFEILKGTSMEPEDLTQQSEEFGTLLVTVNFNYPTVANLLEEVCSITEKIVPPPINSDSESNKIKNRKIMVVKTTLMVFLDHIITKLSNNRIILANLQERIQIRAQLQKVLEIIPDLSSNLQNSLTTSSDIIKNLQEIMKRTPLFHPLNWILSSIIEKLRQYQQFFQNYTESAPSSNLDTTLLFIEQSLLVTHLINTLKLHDEEESLDYTSCLRELPSFMNKANTSSLRSYKMVTCRKDFPRERIFSAMIYIYQQSFYKEDTQEASLIQSLYPIFLWEFSKPNPSKAIPIIHTISETIEKSSEQSWQSFKHLACILRKKCMISFPSTFSQFHLYSDQLDQLQSA